MITWHEFPDRDTWADGVAEAVARSLATLLAAGIEPGLVVPGGRTPVPVLQRLQALDWQRIHLTLTDERWVPRDHPASNAGMLVDSIGPAAETSLLPLFQPGMTAFAAQHHCQQLLSGFPWQHSLCLLGMGADGHFASLFPHAPQLALGLDPAAQQLCLPVPAADCVGGEPQDRMSLTLAALLRCRRVLLLVAGTDKKDVLLRAQQDEAAPLDLPIAALLHQQQVPVDLYWAA